MAGFFDVFLNHGFAVEVMQIRQFPVGDLGDVG